MSDQSDYAQLMTRVAEWETYAQTRPDINPTSEVGADALAGYPEVAMIAWHGIAVAVDHLALIREAGPDEPPVRVLSIPTVSRGALLAGCRTVWILSGSDPGVRRHRALRILAQDAKEEQKTIDEFANVFPGDDEVAQAVRESAEAVDLTTKRCLEAGFTPKRLVEGDIVAEAAKYLAETSGRESMRGSLTTSWRTMSGHAHGYMWVGKPALDKPSRADVVSAVTAGLLATGEAIEMFRAQAAGKGQS